jgi:hypothetical protein
MSTPETVYAGKTTGELRPYDHEARLSGAQQAEARRTSCRTNGPACRGHRKLPDSSGVDSNRTLIWGIPVYMDLDFHILRMIDRMKFGLLPRALMTCAAFAMLPACGGSVNTTPIAPRVSALPATAATSGVYAYQMPTSGSFTGLLDIPGSSVTVGNGAIVTLASSATDPTTAQAASKARRTAQSSVMNAPYDYFSITWSAQVTSPVELDFTLTPPNGAPAAGTKYYEEVNDTSGTAGWQTGFAGPFTSDGSTVTFYVPANVVFQPGHAYVLAAYTLTSSAPSPTPTATPTPAPTPAGPISLSPNSVSLLGLGSSNAQTVTASETGYTGAFSSTGTACSGIATVAVSGSTLTVTGIAAGTCSATITDSFNQTKSLSITVTTSGLSVN